MKRLDTSDAYPICANPAPMSRSLFSDIDEQAAQLVGHDQAYQQISPGAFRGGFTTAVLGPEQWLFIEEANQALVQQGSTPADQCSFMFMLDDDGWCRFQGQDFTAADLGLLLGASPYAVRSPANSRFCVITLDRSSLTDVVDLDGLGLKSSGKLGSAQMRSIVGALRSLVSTTLPILQSDSSALRQTATLSNLRQALVSTLSLALLSDYSRQADGDHRLYRRACDLIEADLRDVDVAKLCRVLQVPRRTLEMTFHRELSIGPARYIKTLRLNQIRREILSDDARDRPLADIAASWGLWHPSHFSESYAEMFGELPSRSRQFRGWLSAAV